jgi:precorrin-6A/cobalt-precorrin-6A reductase
MKKVLILGGTGEATQLAASCATIPKVEIISSLAGRTTNPISPTGNVRIGGFGGQTGLTDYIKQMNIDILIDATHPFAAQISFNAAIAAESTNIPRLMLIRPTWQKQPEDKWIEVDSVESAAATLHHAKRVFLTVGKQQLPAFAKLDNIWFIMRLIELPPTSTALLPPGEFICDRGPFSLDNEREIILKHNIDTIVSKNSGGDATIAKIIAARELGIPVVMVNRPPTPPGERVSNVDKALIWLMNKLDNLDNN